MLEALLLTSGFIFGKIREIRKSCHLENKHLENKPLSRIRHDVTAFTISHRQAMN